MNMHVMALSPAPGYKTFMFYNINVHTVNIFHECTVTVFPSISEKAHYEFKHQLGNYYQILLPNSYRQCRL